jgi:hypothetical protein
MLAELTAGVLMVGAWLVGVWSSDARRNRPAPPGGWPGMLVEIWFRRRVPVVLRSEARFEQALAAFPHRDQVQVVWRSFELDPRARPSGPDVRRSPGCQVRRPVERAQR